MNAGTSLLVPLALAAGGTASTTLGGLLAIRLRALLPMLMGFAAGVVVGLVCFDLLPEILSRIGGSGYDARVVMGALACGFLLFHVLEKTIVIHHHEKCAGGRHPHVGVLSALALIGHSTMDGVGIGFAFQAGWKVGLAVGLAVVAHDIVDGINTIVVMLGSRNTTRQALPFLALDAAAPVLGVLGTLWIRPSPSALVLYLAFFAGFLLYIGASHVLPEAHSERSRPVTVLLTLLGALMALGVSLYA